MISITNKKLNTAWLHIAMLSVAIVIAYWKSFYSGFLSWDDGEYILYNADIKHINPHNIKAWFTHYYVGNYHPLTMLSYAIDYLIGGVHPVIYHVTNMVLHISNSIIVYLLIKKLQPNPTLAFFVALLFALHPMQTESVSWVAEQKTLLSSLFYLIALLQYATYATTPTIKRLLWVIAAGACAMLSKGTAVALPIALFAIDIWLHKPRNTLQAWAEKAPLFLMSLVMGVVAMQAQESGKFLDTQTPHHLGTNLLYAGYAYIQYIIRLFAPINLSAMYPYPETIGVVQYVFLLLAVGIIVFACFSNQKRLNVLCGGILFYTANILFVLQLIPFGEALTADRYTYLASIGIIYPALFYTFKWFSSKENLAVAANSSIAATLLVMTFVRNTAWQSDTNFFDAMLGSFPNSAVAQYSAGAMYLKNGDYANAELHLNKAVRLDPDNDKAWHNKGSLYLRQGRFSEALTALNRSIAINGNEKAYFTRALLHHAAGNPSLALIDLRHVLIIQPRNARAWHLQGDCQAMQNNYKAAIQSYSKAILLDNKEPLFFIRRGAAFSKTGQNNMALHDLETAVSLNPASGEALYYLGIIKYEAKQDPCPDLKNALQHGYTRAGEAIDKLCKGGN